MSTSQESKMLKRKTAFSEVKVKTEPFVIELQRTSSTGAMGVAHQGMVLDTHMPPPNIIKTYKSGHLVSTKTERKFTSNVVESPTLDTQAPPLKKIKTENGGHVNIIFETESQRTSPGSEAMDAALQEPTVSGADDVEKSADWGEYVKEECTGSVTESMNSDLENSANKGTDGMKEPTGPGTEGLEEKEKDLTGSVVVGRDKALDAPRAPKVRKIEPSATVIKIAQADLNAPNTGAAPARIPFSDVFMGFSVPNNDDQSTLPSGVGSESDPSEGNKTTPSVLPIVSEAEVPAATVPEAEAATAPHVPEVPCEELMEEEEPTFHAAKVQEEPPEVPTVSGDGEQEETKATLVEEWDKADVPTAPKVRKVQRSVTAVQTTQAAQGVLSSADPQPMPRYMTRQQARRLNIKIVPQY